ncbi:hypothetical protein TSTA_068180 [Talaromyces stipitatus ATCC 10500]|uniref:Uncharacterized protein n=1 Tax=Talaromyces stipitatus (strain ATCC 10500 / CBS 375.48 / QM 6759 / NRRL 1006) TaxID=441959 RepID=B8LYN3_TALSN|nr:uncharacterized protein TSTA_068180 [Talaromyces stipitatus ATCC 10500]EED23391.1 hypothetical protein TSTA_068180 [Talaromyces stipitatus ATCC 10500]
MENIYKHYQSFAFSLFGSTAVLKGDKNGSKSTDIPSFTDSDWQRLSQIHRILTKFNELTLFVSKRRPQISLAIPVYYGLYDLLSEGSELQGSFKELDPDIASALKEGLKKYMKYYTFMDESEIYYTVLILDPRVKGDLILKELEDKEAGNLILQATHDSLHQKYLPTRSELPTPCRYFADIV